MSNANANYWLAIMDDDVPESTPEITNDKEAHAAKVKEMTDGNITFHYIPVQVARYAPQMLQVLKNIRVGELSWRDFMPQVIILIEQADEIIKVKAEGGL